MAACTAASPDGDAQPARFPRFFIGPMSRNVTDAIIDLAYEINEPIGLIPSRRQVEHDGGYVCNWTTTEFCKYVRDRCNTNSRQGNIVKRTSSAGPGHQTQPQAGTTPRSLIVLERDHGGPGQGLDGKDDGYVSFASDVQVDNFDIIHVDPWKLYPRLQDGIDKTIEYMEFLYRSNPQIYFEVGTEEAIRKYEADDLDEILRQLKLRLSSPAVFNRIRYAVVQSGTRIDLGNRVNTGKYDEHRLKQFLKVCRKFGVMSKEHNGDFLRPNACKRRFDIGLDAVNIAPAFGQLETMNLLLALETSQHLLDRFFQICLDSKRWCKWVDLNSFKPEERKEELMMISGHYVLSTEAFLKLKVDMEAVTKGGAGEEGAASQDDRVRANVMDYLRTYYFGSDGGLYGTAVEKPKQIQSKDESVIEVAGHGGLEILTYNESVLSRFHVTTPNGGTRKKSFSREVVPTTFYDADYYYSMYLVPPSGAFFVDSLEEYTLYVRGREGRVNVDGFHVSSAGAGVSSGSPSPTNGDAVAVTQQTQNSSARDSTSSSTEKEEDVGAGRAGKNISLNLPLTPDGGAIEKLSSPASAGLSAQQPTSSFLLHAGDSADFRHCIARVENLSRDSPITVLCAGMRNVSGSGRSTSSSTSSTKTSNTNSKDKYRARVSPEHEKLLQPWGHEVKLNTFNHSYVFKEMFVKSGKKTGLYYNRLRKKTQVLFEGQAKIHFRKNPRRSASGTTAAGASNNTSTSSFSPDSRKNKSTSGCSAIATAAPPQADGSSDDVNQLYTSDELTSELVSAVTSVNVPASRLLRIQSVNDSILYECSTVSAAALAARIGGGGGGKVGSIASSSAGHSLRLDDDTVFLPEPAETKVTQCLILTAGKSPSMKSLCEDFNKALLPIEDKAIITHIINKFPKNTRFVVGVGFRKDQVKSYLKAAHPDREFVFVDNSGWTDTGADSSTKTSTTAGDRDPEHQMIKGGPGKSMLQCKEFLHPNTPFYFSACDLLFDEALPIDDPNLNDRNWVAVKQVNAKLAENYCNFSFSSSAGPASGSPSSSNLFSQQVVKQMYDKEISPNMRNTKSFIGIGYIADVDHFWPALENAPVRKGCVQMTDGLLSLALNSPTKLTAVDFNSWIDVGSYEQYSALIEARYSNPQVDVQNVLTTTSPVHSDGFGGVGAGGANYDGADVGYTYMNSFGTTGDAIFTSASSTRASSLVSSKEEPPNSTAQRTFLSKKARDKAKNQPPKMGGNSGGDFNWGKTDEYLYFVNKRVVKFFANAEIAQNRYKRANLKEEGTNETRLHLFPEITHCEGQFLAYKFVPGRTLYEQCETKAFVEFLDFMDKKVWKLDKVAAEKHDLLDTSDKTKKIEGICRKFYIEKTYKRLALFYEKYPAMKEFGEFVVNNEALPTMETLLEKVPFEKVLVGENLPGFYHGDCNFDNIVYDETARQQDPEKKKARKFTMIDWRQDFNGSVEIGDIYYDLAKINCGILMNFDLIKKNHFSYVEDAVNPASPTTSSNKIPKTNNSNSKKPRLSMKYDFLTRHVCTEMKEIYFRWLEKKKCVSVEKVRFLSSIVWLNMAPLHHHPFDKLLFALALRQIGVLVQL